MRGIKRLENNRRNQNKNLKKKCYYEQESEKGELLDKRGILPPGKDKQGTTDKVYSSEVLLKSFAAPHFTPCVMSSSNTRKSKAYKGPWTVNTSMVNFKTLST